MKTEAPPRLVDLVPGDATSSTDAARRIMASLGLTRTQSDVLLPAVAHWVANHMRNAVRQMEQVAIAQTFRPVPAPPPAPRRNVRADGAAIAKQVSAHRDAPAWWATLLDLKFRVDRGGKLVTWGSTTADEHEARADALEKHSAATLVTADRHRAAAKALRDAGAATLNELHGRVKL